MGWETRRGKKFYYRKERSADGRVRSVYIGGGEVGVRAGPRYNLNILLV